MNKSMGRVVALGWIAGMRSMAAPALISHHYAQHPPRRWRGTMLEWLSEPAVASTLKVVAAGELLADKMPFIPARIKVLPLAGRAASGALVGAAISRAEGDDMLTGALLGGVAAVAASYVMYYLRQTLTQRLGVPDPAVAVLEDALATGGGALVND